MKTTSRRKAAKRKTSSVRTRVRVNATEAEVEASYRPWLQPRNDELSVRHAGTRLPPGLHVAPFRDVQGRLVIVHVGQNGGLADLWPVTGIAHEWELTRTAPPAPIDLGVRRHRAGDQIEDYSISNTKSMNLPRVLFEADPLVNCSKVLVCPWGGKIDPGAYMVAILDNGGCAMALNEVPSIDQDGLDVPLAFLGDIRSGAAFGTTRRVPFEYFPSVDGGAR